MIKRLSDDTTMLFSMITASADFIVAILDFHFPRMQSVSSTNVDEDESAFVALRLWPATAEDKEQ